MQRFRLPSVFLMASMLAVSTSSVQAQSSDFPPHAKVLEGFEKVVTKPKITTMYTLYQRKKDGQMYAELPRTYAMKKYFIAMTLGSGGDFAGLQGNDIYVYWKRYNKRLALMLPQIENRATKDRLAQSSVKRLFTDTLLIDVPIVTIGPGGGPVIDLDALFVSNSSRFFGGAGAIGTSARYGVYSIATAKAFKNNIEVAFEVPSAAGNMKRLHYSVSEIPSSTGYKPRVADQRIGYFTTAYTDLAKYDDDETRVRYINRWHLEKADPSLALSPPKKPIVFYIEHTTPVRYRRWVKDGILAWNKAFEKVGIADAIEVYYQDATSGAHMDKDPEDVNYNFVRWLNNNIGTAIGPSRVHPLTGQILDADIVLTDGWVRNFKNEFTEMLPKTAMQGFSPETLAWLAENPNWDPRLRLADPSRRYAIAKQIAIDARKPMAGHPIANADPTLYGDDEFDGLNRASQLNGYCGAAEGAAFDLAMMRMTLALLDDEEKADKKKTVDKDEDEKEGKDSKKKDDDKDDDDDGEKKEEKESPKPTKPKGPMIDGMPESFVGPLVAHLVAHEVGHTLGLRHNFKGSSRYTMAEINSEKIKGKEQLATTVMDYIGANIDMGSGEVQGDWCMTSIGPYDMWAIEFGYTTGDTKKVLAKCGDPDLQYGTDEDSSGPDPYVRRYDFGKDPLAFAENQIRLSKYHRDRLLTDFVKDGESWDRVRYGYNLTLGMQTRAVSMMANWVGGAHIYRHKKGDPNGKMPIEVVPAEKQRDAVKFVLEHSFRDEAFGLTPELLTATGLDQWMDSGTFGAEATWPVHDRVVGIQASALTMLMNPTTLRRVYDNELRVAADEDCLTLPELLTTITDAVWTELKNKPDGKFTTRKPMISSLRRNLQREHVERLVDLTLPGSGNSAASRTISMLAAGKLREIHEQLGSTIDAGADKHDAYTAAHLSQAKERIAKALDADYILNPSTGGGGGGNFGLLFGRGE